MYKCLKVSFPPFFLPSYVYFLVLLLIFTHKNTTLTTGFYAKFCFVFKNVHGKAEIQCFLNAKNALVPKSHQATGQFSISSTFHLKNLSLYYQKYQYKKLQLSTHYLLIM